MLRSPSGSGSSASAEMRSTPSGQKLAALNRRDSTEESERLLSPQQQDKPPPKGKAVAAQIALFMTLWYVMSGATLFGNKHIMTTLGADPNLLACCQMFFTAIFGAFKMYAPALGIGKPQPTPLSAQPFRNFMLDMLAVGVMRFTTVMLGLVSLKYVAVSFTETVKSSAPFFTVLFARLMLDERTSLMVSPAAPLNPSLPRISRQPLRITAPIFHTQKLPGEPLARAM